MVFSWVILPTQTLHELFADHEDTEHGYCAKYHSHLGTHYETKHTHCDILDTNTPIYEKASFNTFETITAECVSIINTIYQSVSLNSHTTDLPARGPPAIA